MPVKTTPLVYLAGPISGCNPEQINWWRLRIKNNWGKEFRFIDPAEDVVPGGTSQSYEIVHRDERAIQHADAVLAHMWKESIGTAIGVAIARAKGKVVVVADPNRLNSKTLAYYADAIVASVDGAMRILKSVLRSQESLHWILKRGGETEEFDRRTLAESIRAACRAARKDDILAPAEIIPRTLALLNRIKKVSKGTVSTKQIRNTVWSVLAELESDPLRQADFDGIREAWERYDENRHRPPATKIEHDLVPIHSRAQKLRIFSGKSHESIWGRAVKEIKHIPAPARRLFQEIMRVDGIAEIRLTAKKSGSRAKGLRAQIQASQTGGIIEGKCIQNAEHGQVQLFQIRVANPERTEAVRRTLIRHLGSLNYTTALPEDSVQ